MRYLATLILSLLTLISFSARAQNGDDRTSECDIESLPRPVKGSYALTIGHTEAVSTYLSPLRYTGTIYGASGEWAKVFQHSPRNWIMRFEGGADWMSLLNPAQTAAMYGAEGRFNWSLMRRFNTACGISLYAGAGADLEAGILYLPRNGNNPANANAAIGLSLAGGASYRLTLGRLPVLISDNVRVPSLSLFFSPQYGETYYEIYLGNTAGLVHAGWWGNRFCIANTLSFSLDFGRTAMQLGYRYEYNSAHACRLNTRISSHAFVIGVIPGGLGLKQKRRVALPY